MTHRAHQPSDADLLAAVPDFLSFGTLAKAVPAESGARRFIWFEASNEDEDHTGEVVLQKALEDSRSYYLRHGNIDLDHYTIMGPKAGIPNYAEYEVGKPLQVERRGSKTFVQAELYTGASPMAKNADMVWTSLTAQQPPARWYASVGGAVLAKSARTDPRTGRRVAVVDRVRWNNVALSRTPANATVPTISTAPVGVFAKSLGGYLVKALEAGNSNPGPEGLTGGGALRRQSLDGALSYTAMREGLASAVRSNSVAGNPTALAAHARDQFGLSDSDAAETVERFLADLRNGRRRTKRTMAHV